MLTEVEPGKSQSATRIQPSCIKTSATHRCRRCAQCFDDPFPTTSNMASAARALRLACRSCRSTRHPLRVHAGPKIFVAWKSASSGGGAVKDSAVKLDDGPKATPFDTWEAETKELEQKYRFMQPSLIAQDLLNTDYKGENPNALRAVDFSPLDNGDVAKHQDNMRELVRPYNRIVKPAKDVFWDEDEMDGELITNDDSDEFDENDMTDVAHAKLEEHREQRAYARIAIWEMPLLSSECDPDYDARRRGWGVTSAIAWLMDLLQNLRGRLSLPRLTSPCDFDIRRTWANSTPPRRRSLSSSVRQTLASQSSSNQS